MSDSLTHAGGVVIHSHNGVAQALLTRASRPPHGWVLPKGHLEPGETPEQAAHREVLEETGADAEVVSLLTDDRYVWAGEPVAVRYFLMKLIGEGAGIEARETRWCNPDEAERLLAYDTARAIVRLAFERAAEPSATRT